MYVLCCRYPCRDGQNRQYYSIIWGFDNLMCKVRLTHTISAHRLKSDVDFKWQILNGQMFHHRVPELIGLSLLNTDIES